MAHRRQGALVVVGSVNTDLTVSLQRLPRPGETIPGNSLDFYAGGKGANQAAAGARLGSTSLLVAQVGDDPFAARLRHSLESCGVDTTLVSTIPGVSSGTALVLLQPGGENSIVIVGGANKAEWKITDAATRAVQTAGAVLLQREIPDAVNTIFAKIARAAGVPVVLDAGGDDGPLGVDLLSNVSVLSPNETELERLTGLPTSTDEQVRVAAQSLVHAGADKVLVKRGSKGSLLVDIHGNLIKQRAAKVGEIVDTTAAGDCFTGAYAVAVQEGKDDAEAMRWASVAAALCIQRRGAIPSLPTRAEVDHAEALSVAGRSVAARAGHAAPSPGTVDLRKDWGR